MFVHKYFLGAIGIAVALLSAASASSSEFNQAWRDKNRALVIDAYEHNEIDLVKMSTDKRIAAFIHKGSDGLPAKYNCSGNKTEFDLCKQTWRRYVIGRELYQTRRALAKTLGMKWGAYHLARPGNPLDQARHFLDYTRPSNDETIVIDLEENDPKKWMSLEDAEVFSRYIYRRLGRWPMLYTNGSTAQFIANNKNKYEILSRLPLWYARYKPSITDHFPKGNWVSYDIWQFQAQINCDASQCPYRVRGAMTI
ncbi:MAG: glycoside hydrolase family 25 protein [Ahrensia sp.]|nr:glycoside hydrolase family 25 protein [Ahrensia sp.]